MARSNADELERSFRQLAALTKESLDALAAALDAQVARIDALEAALQQARAKKAGTNGHGLIIAP